MRPAIVGELLFHYAGKIRTIPMQIGGNKRVAQLMANKILIQNNIGNFQIPIEKLETFKEMLIQFYESGNDRKLISFMKEYCIRQI